MKLTSTFGRVLTVAAAVVAAAVIVSAFQVGAGAVIRSLAPTGLLVFLTWAAFWRPAVLVHPDDVEVRNVFSTDVVPFTQIRSIDTRYALTLDTLQGKVTAWAAPAPGRHSVLTASRDDGQHLPSSTYLAGTVRPGDLTTSDSGAAAAVIRRRWEEIRDDLGTIGDGEPVTRVRRYHLTTIAASAVLLVATIVSLSI